MNAVFTLIFAFICIHSVSAVDIATWKDAQTNAIYYDNNGSGSWSDTSRWVGGIVPGPQNSVVINNAQNDKSVTITDADLDVFTNVYWYSFTKSRITIDCLSDIKYTGCFRAGNRSEIIKMGTNTFEFTPINNEYCTYMSSTFIVSNGCMKMGKIYFYEKLAPVLEVWKPGILELDPNSSSYLLGLVGDGVVTNRSNSWKAIYFRSYFHDLLGRGPWAFSGTLSSNLKPVIGNNVDNITHRGEQHFLGENSIRSADSTHNPQIYKGVIGVEYPGYGMGNPASLRGSLYQFFGCPTNEYSDMTFLYLGKGGVTDIGISFYNRYGTARLILDGGADGGLILARSDNNSTEYGSLRNLAYVNCNASQWEENNQPKRTDVTAERIVLTGANLNPCVISNYIYDAADATYICFIKRGTGTWRFAERPYEDCGNRGPVFVEQGRLEFDSFRCLGKGDRPFTNFWEGASDELCRVPYIYRLGNGVNDASAPDLPTMAYLGADAESSSRTFAVFGSGRIENAGGGLELNGGVFSDKEGDNTLVLAGSGENKFTHVTNGVGTLCVVKEDDGEWELLGDVILSGAEVNEGTLKFDGTSTCPKLKVDGGAFFEAETSDLAVNNFKVDAAKGAGTVKGVVFENEGLLELFGAEEGARVFELGGDFTGSAGISNLCNWSVVVNGRLTTKYIAGISSNTLKVSRRGIKIILR